MKTKYHYSSRVELIKSTGGKYLRINLHRIIYRDNTISYRVSRVFDGVIEQSSTTLYRSDADVLYQCFFLNYIKLAKK